MDFLTFSTYFTQNPGVLWIVFAAALIVFEVTVPGIGGLFSAVAALTIGALMILEIIVPQSFVEQLAYFFGFTILWAIILWKPLQKLMQGEEPFSDIIGTRGIIAEGDLKKGKPGKVKWSGVNMNAELSEHYDKDTIKNGSDVWIVGKSGMTLIVDTEKEREVPTTNNNTQANPE